MASVHCGIAMTRYDTPVHIAELLAKLSPERCRSVLDPSVGSGVLVREILKLRACSRVEVVDIDRKAIKQLSIQPEFNGVRSHPIDFIKWTDPGAIGSRKRFDCIVMNPPFAGRKDQRISKSARHLVMLSSRLSKRPLCFALWNCCEKADDCWQSCPHRLSREPKRLGSVSNSCSRAALSSFMSCLTGLSPG